MPGQDPPLQTSRSSLKAEIADYLRAQGIDGPALSADQPLATALAEIVLHDCLDWTPAQIAKPGQEFDHLIGFAFGHRFEPNGNRSPGPINRRLAGIVAEKYEAHHPDRRPTVWAQWEIAEELQGTSAGREGNLQTINPEISVELDRVEYASTASVVEKVRSALQPDERPTALVVAHPDQSRRCLRAVHDAGFDARAVAHHVTDPATWYDPRSGQLWTRSRILYLLHDVLMTLTGTRDRANAPWSSAD